MNSLSVCLVLAAGVVGAGDAPRTQAVREPKRIFAHYMGCYPAASRATPHHRANIHRVRHDGEAKFDAIGSRWRSWPLLPSGTRLSMVRTAELEIRRALRGGIDGFAIDAWAGGDDAKAALAALLQAARDKKLPFAVTICIDPNCLKGTGGKRKAVVEAIRYLLAKHGKNPKLARRGGKVLVFGYQSLWPGVGYGSEVLARRPEWKGQADLWKSPALRTAPEGWALYGEAYRRIAKDVGQPIYFHFGMGAFFHGVSGKHLAKRDDLRVAAAGELARHFPAVGEFLGGGAVYDRMAAAVRAAGAEWAEPMWFQYENLTTGHNQIPKGTDVLRERWRRARENGSTLIQFITWNDYTENTSLAPGYDTRYAVLDLNGYFVRWWKAGRPPKVQRDRAYVFYRKYAKGARVFPFRAKRADDGVLEVVTILTAPAEVRLPGRDVHWDAPAGLSCRQFPLSVGAVAVEAVRDGKKVLRLDSPEPITDRPYRQSSGLVGLSTEFERHWRADFGEARVEHFSEYADADGDGLPNWFEMYWFGKFLDFSTATAAEPKADPDGDGLSNIEEYRMQSDPTKPPGAGEQSLRRAREITEYIQKHFWDAGRGLYRGFHPRRRHSLPYAFMWDNAVQFTVLTAAIADRPEVYRPVMEKYFRGLDAHWDARRKPPGYQPYHAGGGDDRYYDDNAWMAIDFVYAYERTKDAKYLRRAEEVLRFVWSGWDAKAGGGIYWHVSRDGGGDKAQKGVCSNATAVYGLLAVARHKTGPERAEGIRRARQIVSWTRRKLQDTDKLYLDHVDPRSGRLQRHKWTYNTAMMIRCHLLLHKLTGSKTDLAEAVAVGRAAKAFVDAKTGAYRDAPFFSHLLAEADLELYRITGEKAFLDRARRTAEHYWRMWKSKIPDELKSVAGMARLFWMLAGAERGAGGPAETQFSDCGDDR